MRGFPALPRCFESCSYLSQQPLLRQKAGEQGRTAHGSDRETVRHLMFGLTKNKLLADPPLPPYLHRRLPWTASPPPYPPPQSRPCPCLIAVTSSCWRTLWGGSKSNGPSIGLPPLRLRRTCARGWPSCSLPARGYRRTWCPSGSWRWRCAPTRTSTEVGAYPQYPALKIITATAMDKAPQNNLCLQAETNLYISSSLAQVILRKITQVGTSFAPLSCNLATALVFF